MNAKPYPKYKPSGVEWMGDVPEHWEVKRLKTVVQLADKKIEADEETPLQYVALENISSWTGQIHSLNADVVPIGIANWFPRGVTLFGKLRPYLAKACNPDFEGLCSSELLVLEPRELNRRFLLHLLLSEGFIENVNSSTYGSKMPRANWEFIGGSLVPVAPAVEQQAISDFLDDRTAKLDALLEKKRALIGTLKEKRSALISRTVTKGIPPSPKLKASGIPWLGDIPEHWKAMKIKYITRIESGHTPSRSVDEYWVDCEIPWISLNDSKTLRKHDYISETHYQINKMGLANSSARMLPAGVVVFSRDATVGLCAITQVPMAVSQHFVAYICGPRLLPEYLLMCLKAMNQHLQSLQTGSTIVTIGMPEVRSLAIPLPQPEEQKQIVQFIKLGTERIDRMIQKVETAVEKLTEYRTALITAVVTGKIDVRKAS